MTTVKNLLKHKDGQLWSVSSSDTAFKALEVMAEKDTGAVLVIDDGKLVGIFSERDYARKVILHGKSSKITKVRDLMTAEVLFVRPDTRVNDCMALMTEKHVRHLPVFDGEQLIGVISVGDVVKCVISEHEFMIGQLENYITGKHS